ncbi:hypothetical protein TWF281_003083 [Arthrobotrys megalospora]
MLATNPSSSATSESTATADQASSSSGVWEAVPSRTPSVSEAEVDTVTEAAEELSLSNADHEERVCKHTIFEVIAESESDFVLYTWSEGQTFDFAVSREVLRITSPVFRELIDRTIEKDAASADGGDDSDQHSDQGSCEYCRGKKNENSLYLQGDDRDALLGLLQIIHCRPNSDLLDASFDLVKRVAVVCEKYQWQEAILPWKKIWIEKYLKHILEPGYEDWLRVAKVFRIEEETTKLIEIMGNECSNLVQSRRSGRNYVSRNGEGICTDLWPQEVLDQILKIRVTKVERLLKGVKGLTDLLYRTWFFRVCKSELCTSLAYGSLQRSIKGKQLSGVLNDYETWRGSVVELRTRITSIEFFTYSIISPDHECRINSLREQFNSYVKESDLSNDIAWNMETII